MTELSWDGKYDQDGKKTAPVRIALPFQTVETVNESAADRQRTLDMFARGKPTEWRNRLIWGDKKYVLPSLLDEFAGQVNLIYIDPPFDTGADFSFTAKIPHHPDSPEGQTASFTKEPSIIEQKAYRDTWGRGLDSYLQWFYETILLLRDLLAENGSMYVHLDWHVGHYAKCILDEVFGYENFRNEIVWERTYGAGSSKAISKRYPSNTDMILYFTKTSEFTFNKQYKPYSAGALKRYDKVDEKGRRFKWANMKSYSQKRLEKMLQIGDAKFNQGAKHPVYKVYLDESKGTLVSNLWNDLAPIGTFSDERVDYATQKPEALLERIIKASSNEADLVLDCFCGSGTTAAAAEKLHRRWLTCDLGRFAIHTARKRLLSIPNVKPFVVQNLGKYERQAWMGAEFDDLTTKAAQEQRYRQFILDLYRSEPLSGYAWLHGAKSGRMVHIGSVDAPVALGDVKQIVQEFWKTAGKTAEQKTNGIDILGWEFAFELNETARQFAAANNVSLKFKKIPREVLEKKAVDQGDIRFFELASLDVEVKTIASKILSVELTDFIVPPDDVPEDVRQSITHWTQWIDYWAVDWNYRNDTFHNEWQSYRTKQQPQIEIKTQWRYGEAGTYAIVIKVIDMLGNDTTKLVEVTVT